MARSQSSIESALLISFMMMVFVVFLLAVTNRIVEIQEKREKELLEDFSFVIENELKLAAIAEDGYTRTIYVAPTIRGKNYTLALVDSAIMMTNFSELSLKYENQPVFFEHVARLPGNINGNLAKGENMLIKREGIVQVRPQE